MKPYAFVAHLGTEAFQLALLHTSGELLEVRDVPDQGSSALILPDLAETIHLLSKQHGISLLDTEGIVLSLPVGVREDGTMVACPELGWESFNVERRMSVLTGVRVKALGPLKQFDPKSCLEQLLKET